MEEKNNDRTLFTNWAQVIRSAKKGVPRKTLAARCGMSVRQFNAVIETRPDLELEIELAIAEYDESIRDELGEILVEAKAEKNLSLAAKILRENQKELNERDKNNRIAEAVENLGSQLFEPDYQDLTEEQLEEIRARTEAESESGE